MKTVLMVLNGLAAVLISFGYLAMSTYLDLARASFAVGTTLAILTIVLGLLTDAHR